jgi:hypothetical protein
MQPRGAVPDNRSSALGLRNPVPASAAGIDPTDVVADIDTCRIPPQEPDAGAPNLHTEGSVGAGEPSEMGVEPRDRGRRGGAGVRVLAIVLLGMCASGCALWSGTESDRGRWRTTAAPELVAWLAGHVAREHFPDTDPLGLPRAPLVERHADGFRIRAVRRENGNGRIEANGRLATVRSFELTADPTTTARPAPPEFEFHPLAVPFEAGPNGAHGVEVHVERDGDGQVEVRARAWGDAVGAVEEIGRCLEFLAALERIGIESRDRPVTAARSLAALLERPVSDPLRGSTTLERLRAPAEAWLGLAYATLDQPLLARAALRRALDHEPWFDDARAWLVRIELRAAKPDAAAHELAVLARSERRGALAARLAAAELATTHTQSTPGTTSGAPTARDTARSRLHDGDPTAARCWMVRAAQHALRSDLDLDLWADLLRRSNSSELALVLDLERADHPESPAELVLAASRSAANLGRDDLGLRLLADHWQRLVDAEETRGEAQQLLGRFSDRLGAERAARILFAQPHDPTLTARQLRRLVRSGDGSRSGISLFARLERLRESAAGASDPDLGVFRDRDDGWRLAPGVAPPR